MPWHAAPTEDVRHDVVGSMRNTKRHVQKYYFQNFALTLRVNAAANSDYIKKSFK